MYQSQMFDALEKYEKKCEERGTGDGVIKYYLIKKRKLKRKVSPDKKKSSASKGVAGMGYKLNLIRKEKLKKKSLT